MLKRSIRANAILYAILPSILSALIVVVSVIVINTTERDQLIREQAQSLAESIAYMAEYNLVNRDNQTMQDNLRDIQVSSSLPIANIVIYNNAGHLFAASKNDNISRVFSDRKMQNNHYLIEEQGEILTITRTINAFNEHKANPEYWNDNLLQKTETRLGFVYLKLDLAASIYKKYRLNIIVLTVIAVGSFITAILILMMTSRVTKPLLSFVETVEKIGKGDLAVRVDYDVQNELKQLKDGINLMAAELQRSHEKLESEVENATRDLQQNLQLVEEKNAELDIARKEALEGSKIKSDFLATMSHEIRTPLNAIIGFTKELSKVDIAPPHNEYVATINASADNLVAIINDVLDFSKIEAGKMELEYSAFNLEQTVEDVVNLMGREAFAKDLVFVLDSDPLPNAAIGDQHRFKQILNNLLSNAIKFTTQGFVVLRIRLISHSQTQHQLLVEVQDSGIGISRDKQKKLFSAFSQADTSTTRRFGGTGLGLAICYGLTKKMSGQLKLNSTVGKGSTFSVTVPLTTSSNPINEKRLDGLSKVLMLDSHPVNQEAYVNLFKHSGVNPDICTETEAWEQRLSAGNPYDLIIIAGDMDEESIELLPLQAAFAKKHLPESKIALALPSLALIPEQHKVELEPWSMIEKPLSASKLHNLWHKQDNRDTTDEHVTHAIKRVSGKINMLAVDDNETNLKLLCAILRDGDVELTTANSGTEACQLAEQQVFDLVLMDVQMPVMDGVEACKRIKSGQLNAKTPIIAFTAHAFKDEREKLLKNGMDDYLAKPIDLNKFNTLVKKWVYGSSVKKARVQVKPKSSTSGIDWSASLSMAGNKHQVAVEMLEMLVMTFDEVKLDLLHAAQNRDNAELLKVIHKFHGATCYTGVPKLKSLAHHIESQLKKDVDINIGDSLAQLSSEMKVVKADLEQISNKEAV